MQRLYVCLFVSHSRSFLTSSQGRGRAYQFRTRFAWKSGSGAGGNAEL